MELHKELIVANLQNSSTWPQLGWLALYMAGEMPTTAAELKAAIDIYSLSDIYDKAIGVQMIAFAKGVAEGHAFQLSNITNRVAFKKGDFDFNLTTTSNNLVPADMKKASIPDRFYPCYASAPFARIEEQLGMAAVGMLRTAQWNYFDNGTTACWSGPTAHAEAQATIVTEYEWDTPRNFGGVLRPFTTKSSASNTFVLTVEAWNPDTQAWDTVIAPVAKAGAVSSANYVAFSKRIRTTRLRVQITYTGTYTALSGQSPHGIVPLEVTADAPAPVAPADIGWAVLIPYTASNFASSNLVAVGNISNPSYPVPLYAARVGLAQDPAAEIILSKVADLTAADRPVVQTTKFLSSNLTME